jgi:hypothetical protein
VALLFVGARPAPPAPDLQAAASGAAGSGAAERAGGQAAAVSAPDSTDLLILDVVNAILRVFEAEADRIWPGFDLSRQPFLVYRAGRWALLVGEVPDAEGFGPYPDGWPDLRHPVAFHAGALEGLAGQLVLDFPVGSAHVAALGIPDVVPSVPGMEGIPDEAIVMGYVVHEAFHRYQEEAFGEIPWEREERYPILERRNTALAAVEMRLLERALAALERGDRERALGEVRRFLAVRRERWSRGRGFVTRFEQGLELHEGTARYVEARAVGAAAGLQERGTLPSRLRLEGLSAVRQLRRELRNRLSAGSLAPEDVPRNRIYPVAAAQGILLDALGVAWKERAQRAGAAFTFPALLGAAVGCDTAWIAAFLQEDSGSPRVGAAVGRSDTLCAESLEEALEDVGFTRILDATDSLARAYEISFREALERFEAQEGTRVSVRFRRSGVTRSRISRGRRWTMDGGRRILCPDYQIYTAKNEGFFLRVEEAAVLEEEDWDGGVRTVTFFVRDPLVEVDGRKVAFAGEDTLAFRALRLEGRGCEVRCERAGQLTARARELVVDLVPVARLR